MHGDYCVCVPEKFEDMCTAAPGEGKRGSVIPEVLAEGVPVTALLILIPAAATVGGGDCTGRASTGYAAAGGVDEVAAAGVVRLTCVDSEFLMN